MSDEAAIRRAALKHFFRAPDRLHEKLGGAPSYWRDLMRDPKKSFGEKVARRIETAFDLPRGALDQVYDDDATPAALAAREPEPAYAAPVTATVSSVVAALSRALGELDESRREAIASSVSRLLVKGPNTGEIAVLKLLTQDLTLSTADVFDLDQKNLVTSAQDRPSLTEEDQWDETQGRVIKTGLGGPRATTSSMTKPKQDPGKEGQQ